MKYNDIKLIVMDVDGTLTDGGVLFDSNGVESKRFSVLDGLGIQLAHHVGITTMILTGRKSVCVEKRAAELKIVYVNQGIHNKVRFLKEFMDSNDLKKGEVAYIGDDLNDLPSMKIVGLSACPSNAAVEVKNQCDYILSKKGGEGAVREFIEIILKNRKQWLSSIEGFFEINK